MQIISFNAKSFRKLENPNGGSVNNYQFYVPVLTICEKIPIFYNNQRLQTIIIPIQREIESTLLDENYENFHISNRGLVISADKINYYKDRSIAVITLTNHELHGTIDGSLTYFTILKLLKNKDNYEKMKNKFVKIEILTGLDYNLTSVFTKARSNIIEPKKVTID